MLKFKKGDKVKAIEKPYRIFSGRGKTKVYDTECEIGKIYTIESEPDSDKDYCVREGFIVNEKCLQLVNNKKPMPKPKLSKQEIVKAMPATKKLVKQHGLTIVNACLSQLKDYEKTLRELEAKKAEVAELEKKVK